MVAKYKVKTKTAEEYEDRKKAMLNMLEVWVKKHQGSSYIIEDDLDTLTFEIKIIKS
jgi:hypothetical protein